MSEINEKENSTSLSLPISNTRPNGSGIPSLSITRVSTESDSRLHFRKSLENNSLRRNSSVGSNSKIFSKISNKKRDDRFGGCLDSDSENGENYKNDNEEINPRGEDSDDNGSDIMVEDTSQKFDLYGVQTQKDNLLRTPLQLKLFYFFEEPLSKWAKAFEMFSNFCLITTIVFLCVTSWPTIYPNEMQIYTNYWTPFDIIALVTFTIEYFGRFYAAVNKRRFFFKFMNLIDLLSIIPFYVYVIKRSESLVQFFRVLRLLRIIKLIQVAKHATSFRITVAVFQRSAYQIVLISVYILVILLSSSALMFYFERGNFHQSDMTWYREGEDGNLEISPFQSIIHSFWWSIVTITTTGYGDAVPVTGLGKLVAAVTMMFGILVIALPTSIIGSNFNNEWSIHRRIRYHMKIKQKREQARAIGSDTRQSKVKRIEVLQKQNQTMLIALGEVQEKLADINPPRYYRKYKKLQIKHKAALVKIIGLEDKLAKLKRAATNLEAFNDHKRYYSDSETGGGKKFSPFRKFNSVSLRNINSLEDNASVSGKSIGEKSKYKNLLYPIKTFGRSLSNLTTQKSQKQQPIFTTELISSPTDMRPSFTPIIDSKKDDNTKLVNNDLTLHHISHYSPSSSTNISEYISSSKDKSVNKDNTNGNEDLDKNDQKNDETRELEIIIDNQGDISKLKTI